MLLRVKRLTAITLLIIEGKIDNESLRHIFDIHQVQASTLLKSLIDEGIIQIVGKSKKFATYKLTESYRQRVFS